MSSTKIFWAGAVALVIASGVAFVGQAGASARLGETEIHCVIEVTGVEAGVMLTEPEVCFGSEAEADIHAASLYTDFNTMPRKLHSWNTAKHIYNQLTRNHH